MVLSRTIARGLGIFLAAVCALSVSSRPGVADEFTLKDGRKITGTIVGYEKDMFRIETDFGFILVRKDKVVSIRVKGEEGETSAPKALGTENKTSEPPAGAPADSLEPAPAARATPSQPPLVSRPINEPLPAHLEEHVQGPEYVNDTFRFSMFKPLGWKLFEGLYREKVSAIVALSSEDERTLLFVDRQVWSGAPSLTDDRVDANLRSTYENYKILSESAIRVDGQEAVRRDFTGVIDGMEWHGVSVRLAKGNTVFGIVGLTSAETYSFQQAVINKIIKSFRFISPEPPKGAALRPHF
jgi:hypothetical protein